MHAVYILCIVQVWSSAVKMLKAGLTDKDHDEAMEYPDLFLVLCPEVLSPHLVVGPFSCSFLQCWQELLMLPSMSPARLGFGCSCYAFTDCIPGSPGPASTSCSLSFIRSVFVSNKQVLLQTCHRNHLTWRERNLAYFSAAKVWHVFCSPCNLLKPIVTVHDFSIHSALPKECRHKSRSI